MTPGSNSTRSTCRATVWWATWDGIDGAVLERQAVTLDSQYSAHRYLQSVRKTVAGFYWRWGHHLAGGHLTVGQLALGHLALGHLAADRPARRTSI